MIARRPIRTMALSLTCVLPALPPLVTACGGSSNSQVEAPLGAGGSGAAATDTGSGSGSLAGTNASSGTGGSDTTMPAGTGANGAADAATGATSASGGAADAGNGAASGGQGSSGNASSSGAAGDAGSCAPKTQLTLAAKISLAVTWPATTAASSGSGTAFIWLLQSYAVNGSALSGTSQICGLTLPDIDLSGLGQIAAGGSKVQIQIPPSVWAKTSMPTFATTASQSGWGPPGTLAVDPSVALIGVSFPAGTDSSTYVWPSSTWSFPQGTTFPDSDDDMNPAVTATPLDGKGYVYPPTAIGLGGSAPVADQVYIASRNGVALSGAWTSCTDLSGSATVSLFDNHVVGCHISGGQVCTTGAANTQGDFLDQNRTIYVPGKASFAAKTMATGATCSDALTELP